MRIDLEKLTPAPWVWEDGNTDPNHQGLLFGPDQKVILNATYDGDLAMKKDDADFVVLARLAFDVMMRRGWHVEPSAVLVGGCPNGWKARKFAGDFCEDIDSSWHPDPFTALVEADKWHRENVEAVHAGHEAS
jgi:hypothetical protein